MTLTTFTSRIAAAVVAAVAGIISYGHIRSVASAAGESDLAAALLPVGIDGLIVVATLAMLEDSRNRRTPRTSARFALGFGIVATIAGNIASAEPTWTARAVAAVPAVSFLIAVEVTARSGKLRRTDAAEPAEDAGVAPDQPTPVKRAPAKARRSSGKRSAADRVAAARQRHPDLTQAELAKKAGVSLRTVARHDRGAAGVPGGAPAEPDGRRIDGVPVSAGMARHQDGGESDV